jgi:hypothetical protein
MKKLIVLTLALFAIQSPAIAQINCTVGNRVSNLGAVSANNNHKALRARLRHYRSKINRELAAIVVANTRIE